ncbi:MAG: hypothetical protein ACREQ9_27460, partial [Candidatus Binatia bacterium]
MMVAQVAVIPPIPGREVLHYSVPSSFQGRAREGARVVVPLGKRQVTGIIVGFAAEPGTNALKEILDVPDEEPLLDAHLLSLARFAASYYVASLGEVLATAVLAGLRAESRRLVCLVGDRAAAEATRGLGRVEREILRRLPAGRAVSTTYLLRSGGGHDAIRSLAARGLVEITETTARAAARARYGTFVVFVAEPAAEAAARLGR